MTRWVILPVKPFEEAKSRLAPALPSAQRAALAAWFFLRTLGIARRFAGSSPVLVVSRSPRVIALAHAAGALGLRETGQGDLNGALRGAAAWALDRGASCLLTLAADLPLLEVDDLGRMIGDPSGPCVLAPDRWGAGTNAMVWRGGGVPPYSYGPGSLAAHQAAVGGMARTVSSAGLALDIDHGDDLRLWSRLQPGVAASAAAIPATCRPLAQGPRGAAHDPCSTVSRPARPLMRTDR